MSRHFRKASTIRRASVLEHWNGLESVFEGGNCTH